MFPCSQQLMGGKEGGRRVESECLFPRLPRNWQNQDSNPDPSASKARALNLGKSTLVTDYSRSRQKGT